ncbi:MAG TPA: hypothetical protein VGN33_13240 [Leifsonia sp.]|nr:hypothetical protein [Leifsonia sp.]
MSVAAAVLVGLAFTGCAGASPSAPSSSASAAAAGLPLVAGDIQGKVDRSKNPFRVVVKSDSKDLLSDIKAKLKESGFSVYPTANDSIGAKNDKFYVSVSVKSGQATYVFAGRH